MESASNIKIQDQTHGIPQNYWGFQEDPWHDSCVQKCIALGNVCAVTLSITSESIAKICNDSLGSGHPLSEGQTEEIAKFCVYLLDKILIENLFSWDNLMVS